MAGAMNTLLLKFIVPLGHIQAQLQNLENQSQATC